MFGVERGRFEADAVRERDLVAGEELVGADLAAAVAASGAVAKGVFGVGRRGRDADGLIFLVVEQQHGLGAAEEFVGLSANAQHAVRFERHVKF